VTDQRIIAFAGIVIQFSQLGYDFVDGKVWRNDCAREMFNKMLKRPNDILLQVRVSKLAREGKILCRNEFSTRCLEIFLGESLKTIPVQYPEKSGR